MAFEAEVVCQVEVLGPFYDIGEQEDGYGCWEGWGLEEGSEEAVDQDDDEEVAAVGADDGIVEAGADEDLGGEEEEGEEEVAAVESDGHDFLF